jgi:hypothetical protein
MATELLAEARVEVIVATANAMKSELPSVAWGQVVTS